MWLYLIFEYLFNYCRIEVIPKYLYFSKQYRRQICYLNIHRVCVRFFFRSYSFTVCC